MAAGAGPGGELMADQADVETALAAVIANAALTLVGKVPVNLNFTAGKASIEAAIRIAEISEVITAGPVIKRLPEFPWPERTLRIEEILPPLKKKIALWRALVFLPWRILAAWLQVPSKGDREEAVILFTSGSAGEPKGRERSHDRPIRKSIQGARKMETPTACRVRSAKYAPAMPAQFCAGCGPGLPPTELKEGSDGV